MKNRPGGVYSRPSDSSFSLPRGRVWRVARATPSFIQSTFSSHAAFFGTFLGSKKVPYPFPRSSLRRAGVLRHKARAEVGRGNSAAAQHSLQRAAEYRRHVGADHPRAGGGLGRDGLRILRERGENAAAHHHIKIAGEIALRRPGQLRQRRAAALKDLAADAIPLPAPLEHAVRKGGDVGPAAMPYSPISAAARSPAEP